MNISQIELKGCFNCTYVVLIKDELFCDWKSSHKSVPFWFSLEMAPVSTAMNGLRCTAWENRLAAQ